MKSIARKLLPKKWHLSYYCPQYIVRLVEKRTNMCVHTGPFKGLHYIDYSCGSVYVPKLLGIYEKELHHVIEEACSMDFGCVVDIGAAEGYYAVGLAMRLPKTTVFAFEAEAEGREAIMKLAQLNNVKDKIRILGRCEVEDLKSALSDQTKSLIVCDVEGYEGVLLDPNRVPALRKAHILVEIHDLVERGLTEKIRSRFAPTHEIEEIWEQERLVRDFPFPTLQTRFFPNVYIYNEMTEFRRERMNWFWMKPKTR